MLTKYQTHSIGEPSKQIFGKTWEFAPTGGGADTIPIFLNQNHMVILLGFVTIFYKNEPL